MTPTFLVRMCPVRPVRFLAAVLLWTPFALPAEQVKVTLDPAHSTVEWTLDATMHTVHGTFKLRSGTIIFDPATGVGNGEFVIDATSAETGNSSRDKTMHKEVLETKRYPEITFLPKRVLGKLPPEGNFTLQVEGAFHIHGATHEVTLTIPVQRTGDTVQLSSDFVVPYHDWGMKNPSNFFLHVSNQVQVKITATGQLTLTAGH